MSSSSVCSLTFKISPVASLEVVWEATLVKGVLYVDLPSGILPEGSKESLITLLEYAEEGLRCSHVVLCIAKNRTDRGSLLRVFNFFGFQLLPPGHKLILNQAQTPDYLHMAYAIDLDDDDDEDTSSSSEEEEEGGGGGRSGGSERVGGVVIAAPPTSSSSSSPHHLLTSETSRGWTKFDPDDGNDSSSSDSSCSN